MDSLASADDYVPVFFVGQHESKRVLPVSADELRQTQDCNYDMLTTPITTPYFQSRVLTLLSSHTSQSSFDESHSSLTNSAINLPLLIPPLGPSDTAITPNETISQLLAVASPWIDLCSPDPVIQDISQQVLSLEIAYAAFCGVGNIITSGPKLHHGKVHGDALVQYARAISDALSVAINVQIEILLPMTDQPGSDVDDSMGSLTQLARDDYVGDVRKETARKPDMYGSWDAWNVIRTVCKYNSRLFVALSLPRHLPPLPIQSRWYSEPLRLLSISSDSFLKNPKGYPVLSKPHQALIARYMRLRMPPWIVLCDVGPIPGLDNPDSIFTVADGSLSPSAAADAVTGSSASPTPSEAPKQTKGQSKKYHDPTPHLSYIRNLQRRQPARTIIERFGAGFQDYLQSPLQPLTDNLESNVYEVFEKDPVKYDWYEQAIARALNDWVEQEKPTSSPDGRVVVAVVGAGRGPLVMRALQASISTDVPIEVWAVEKNPNAYVLLQLHNQNEWLGQVNVVKSDMRAWKGPWREGGHNAQAHPNSTDTTSSTRTDNAPSSILNSSAESESASALQPTPLPDQHSAGYGYVDILVSELLGSFGDNELSPECLDGIQHVLHPTHGISIPTSYSAHLTPISAPKLHADIAARTLTDASAPETPWVVMLHAIDYLSTTTTTSIPANTPAAAASSSAATPSLAPAPTVHTAWTFTHPLPPALSTPGSNAHNARHARLAFRCRERGVCHGLAGYFETDLYRGVELSTNPVTMGRKSADMISWFPIFFPLKTPLYFPDHSELEVSVWRRTDDRKVWYEWIVEAFVFTALLGGEKRRVRLGVSDLHSSRKNGCLM